MDGDIPSDDDSLNFIDEDFDSDITEEAIEEDSDATEPHNEDCESEGAVGGSMSPDYDNMTGCSGPLTNFEEANMFALEIALAESARMAAQSQNSKQEYTHPSSLEKFEGGNMFVLDLALAESARMAAQSQNSKQQQQRTYILLVIYEQCSSSPENFEEENMLALAESALTAAQTQKSEQPPYTLRIPSTLLYSCSSLGSVEDGNVFALELALAESARIAAQSQNSKQQPNTHSSTLEKVGETNIFELEIALAESRAAARSQNSEQPPSYTHSGTLEKVGEANIFELEIALAESRAAARSQNSKQPPSYTHSSTLEKVGEANIFELEIALAESRAAARSQNSEQPPSYTGSASSSPKCTSPSCDCKDNNGSYFPDSTAPASSTPALCTQPPEPASRKRPHDGIGDIRAGQWVGVAMVEGTSTPGMFIKRVGDRYQVSLCTPKKSGWTWWQKVEVERRKVTKNICHSKRARRKLCLKQFSTLGLLHLSRLSTTSVCHSPSPAVTDEIHTPRCCKRLLAIDIKGWKLHLPREDEEVRVRNRSELLKLLNELTTVLKFFDDKKCNDVNLKYFRRLASKLRRHLSPKKSTVYLPLCSCLVVSGSCAGFVCGPPVILENIRCEFTERLLPPVIFQTFGMKPPWLRIHEEIVIKLRNKKVPDTSCRLIKRPLTFAHMTSQHLPAVKCLLGTYFWSNVDVSTVLQYPEFTCVVLYGKLVVGFGYLSPGAHRNEGYINFLFVRPHWRRCGIGETILYLLRQQCLFWTLTLHVSPNSEALNLYHKFGFKTYCRIKNFYAGYVISNSQSEQDALFMKLESRIPQMF